MPSSFDDVRIDPEIERGALGGPIFKTNVARLNSGHAKRLQMWSQPLGRWDIAYGLRDFDDQGAIIGMRKIINFFYARRGRLKTFRFKDWADYEITADEEFGVGDTIETIFQLTKAYIDEGSFSFVKTITKPVNGTIVIKVDGVTQTETTHYTIDYSTGLVTFVSPPGSGLSVTWTGEFDKHVSFEEDKVEIDIGVVTAASIPAIPILEERE
jgi:uncharacterized protein (TIGR02217 family)